MTDPRPLRGFVYRAMEAWSPDPEPWVADIGQGTWNDEANMSIVDSLGDYATQQEALSAICVWLAENEATTKAYEAGGIRA